MRRYIFAALLAASSYANADPIFVGNWEVDQGPSWGTKPLAYTGQQAAALLFSSVTGDSNPLDYIISTVDNTLENINNSAWYSVIGYPSGSVFAQDYVSSNSSQAPGFYYSGNQYPGSQGDAASAYVSDNATGRKYTNYAFYAPATVPEPTTIALLGLGLLGVAASRRKSAKSKNA